MPINNTWSTEIFSVVTNSDWGFLGNIIPLILVLGISWALVKKVRNMGFIQLPLAIAMKVIFPFFHIAFIIVSLAIFIMNLIGSKGDLLADVKETPKKVKDAFETPLMKAKRTAERLDAKQVLENLVKGRRKVE